MKGFQLLWFFVFVNLNLNLNSSISDSVAKYDFYYFGYSIRKMNCFHSTLCSSWTQDVINSKWNVCSNGHSKRNWSNWVEWLRNLCRSFAVVNPSMGNLMFVVLFFLWFLCLQFLFAVSLLMIRREWALTLFYYDRVSPPF